MSEKLMTVNGTNADFYFYKRPPDRHFPLLSFPHSPFRPFLSRASIFPCPYPYPSGCGDWRALQALKAGPGRARLLVHFPVSLVWSLAYCHSGA